MPPTSTVVVFGASGNVGLHVVKGAIRTVWDTPQILVPEGCIWHQS